MSKPQASAVLTPPPRPPRVAVGFEGDDIDVYEEMKREAD